MTSSRPAEPKRIGRYDVVQLLGQGGMGRVWLARDTVLGRHVAIKVLRDDLALPPSVRDELLLRMRHEAQAAAAVSHPNIVTLHDMGEDDVVGLFLVFEYVPGPEGKEPESLRDRLRRGPLTLPEVAKLARELGGALSFAHEAGVIHRDVKPENVLFSRTGAKIADFGIARIPDSTITRANTVLGTPAYTAPEALSKGDFGPASDQFSLSATLYEATTAARAFGGEDAIVTAGKVSSEAPPPLHETIAPDAIRMPLEAALTRGLAKDPKDRFASCAELGGAIARAAETKVGPDILELERTPLSSRISLAEKARSERPQGGETPRPSIFIRKRTHRFQNIAAAAALLVIVILILVGRKSTSGADDPASPSAKPSASSVPVVSTPPPTTTPKPSRSAARPQTPRATQSAAPPVIDDGGTDGSHEDD